MKSDFPFAVRTEMRGREGSIILRSAGGEVGGGGRMMPSVDADGAATVRPSRHRAGVKTDYHRTHAVFQIALL